MTKITGHRGARNMWAENSLTGFRNAMQLGCDHIEFDVHLTSSDELVVIHDPTLDRTTESTGLVWDLTPEQRRAVKLKDSDDTLSTLDEVLELLKQGNTVLFVEIKHGVGDTRYPGIVPKVIERLRAHGLEKRTQLVCFERALLEECRSVAPEISRLNPVNEDWVNRAGGFENVVAQAKGLVDVIGVNHLYLAKHWDLVTSLWPKEKLGAWTINDEPTMRHFLELGVGEMTSDQPDLALKLRQEIQGIAPL